jgi:cysteine desulfurase/selenocysteine lyase
VRAFLNAASVQEIIFTRSTTESINLVASSFGGSVVKAGDEIVITGMEHHSNIVPWQLLCERTGATLKVVPFTDAGELILEEYERLLAAGG